MKPIVNPKDAEEMKLFRKRFGLNQLEMAHALGYKGREPIAKVEQGVQPIPASMRLRMKNFEMEDPQILKETSELKDMVEALQFELKEIKKELKENTRLLKMMAQRSLPKPVKTTRQN